MWLKRLVGVFMILTFAGLNTLVVVGLFKTPPKKPVVNAASAPATVTIPAPTVSVSVDPSAIAVGSVSGITWTTTGSPDSCKASGSWDGDKTIYGSESTGRINTVGEYTYTLTCTNKAGSNHADAKISVTSTPPAASHSSTSSSAPSTTTVSATYCQNQSPCYGKADIAKHGSAGNCWGYYLGRVIDVGGFDAAYHQTRSGISNIQISSVCGKDLTPGIVGSITIENLDGSRHNSSTKNNEDPNEAPYFVGYYDANK